MPELPPESQPFKNLSSPARGEDFASSPADEAGKKPGVLWPLLPPVALFGVAFAFSGAGLPDPLGPPAPPAAVIAAAPKGDWIVPASETIVVKRQAASSYAVLRGRLRYANGQAVASPSRGQVARIMARVGQSVRAGDPLMLISRGTMAAPRSSSPLERWQNQAEDAQIAAAKQQENLESRMSSANGRLVKAQARVASAQQRVADARELVRRLQKGESIERDEVRRPTPTPQAQPTPRANNDAAQSGAREAALRESQRLGKSADAAEAKARAAARAASSAQSEAREAQAKLDSATSALAAVKSSAKTQPEKAPVDAGASGKTSEGKTNEKSSSAPSNIPDTRRETQAVAAAREAAAAATSRAASAKREADQAQSRASTLRKSANDAARRATQSLQVFDGDANSKSARTVKNPPVRESGAGNTASGSGNQITIADAARIAQSAMQESDKAIADADRIRKEIASYENPVAGTRRRFDSATQRLQDAQQQIWNTAAGASRPAISSVSAPASGVVLWVAGMASEVRGGELVASIGRPDQLEVVITDSSGAWKSLKPDARILALVKNQTAPAGNPALSNPAATPASARTGGSTPFKARPAGAVQNAPAAIEGTPTLARVVAIAPPPKAGAPARIRIAIHNPPHSGTANRNGMSPRAFAPGMGVLFSIARPGKGVSIRVPAASIYRDENSGKLVVAVLSPMYSAPSEQLTSACRVEWRPVKVGSGDGINNQILEGLQPGERVALRPKDLHKFISDNGSQATVHVEQT